MPHILLYISTFIMILLNATVFTVSFMEGNIGLVILSGIAVILCGYSMFLALNRLFKAKK